MKESRTPGPKQLLCPSATSDADGAVVFGVVGGTAAEPIVSYLDHPRDVTAELLALAGPVDPREVFRIAAPCAERACLHFDGQKCQLGERIVVLLPAAVDRLPACRLRSRCRWWTEQGLAACMRCPVVVTRDFRSTELLQRVAGPGSGFTTETTH